MKAMFLATLSVALFLSACADPAANKPKATTTAPTNTSNTSTAPAANAPLLTEMGNADVLSGFKVTGTELTIAPETSKVEFTGSKVTGKHDGGFKAFKGVIDLVEGKAEKSRVAFEIEMASLFSDSEGLTKHLQTGDFFEIEKFPKSSFISTMIAAPAAAGGNYTVTGELVMRGVKKSITFPATIEVKGDEANVKAEFSINRKDFGIVYAGKADDLIRDDVVLRLDLKAAKKK